MSTVLARIAMAGKTYPPDLPRSQDRFLPSPITLASLCLLGNLLTLAGTRFDDRSLPGTRPLVIPACNCARSKN